MRNSLLAATLALLSACNANAPPAESAAPAQPAPAAAAAPLPATPAPASAPPAETPPPASATPAFADRVWRVADSSSIEAGTTYTFLSGGTLVVDAPHGTPSTGRWRYQDGKLVMTEEGIAYPTDILALDASHFTIRSHNPGGTLDIAMVAAPDAPLPR